MKINQLVNEWPFGTVATTAFLEANGVSRKLASQYCASGWLDSVGHGAFVRHGDKVGWPGAVHALQETGIPVHPGGLTLLELRGYAHYLPMGARPLVRLYGPPGLRLPRWFQGHDWQADVTYVGTGLFTREPATTSHAFGNFSLQVSSLEQAILEVLDGVPDMASFEHAQQLMEGLVTLRPAVMQALLETCTSIKVKRLCLYLADVLDLPWRKKLDDSRIELGAGKRQIVIGGKLDNRYHITVPREGS